MSDADCETYTDRIATHAETVGIEPTHPFGVYSLANCCLTTRPRFPLVGVTGLEPATTHLLDDNHSQSARICERVNANGF